MCITPSNETKKAIDGSTWQTSDIQKEKFSKAVSNAQISDPKLTQKSETYVYYGIYEHVVIDHNIDYKLD